METVIGPVGPIEFALEKPAASVCEHRLALICHPHPMHEGTMNNKVVTTLSRAYQTCGVAALRFNYRGVGHSAGEYADAVGEVDDAIAVLMHIIEQHNYESIWLNGFSFGAYIASAVAERLHKRVKIEGLLMIAPIPKEYPFDIATLNEYNAAIFVGDQDEMVSVDTLEAWHQAEALNGPLTVIPDASHFFHGCLTPLKRAVIAHYHNRIMTHASTDV